MRCRLLALMLLVTACGGAADVALPASSARTEIAPDFTLELGTGGAFTLTDENRPVYLLFWAEW